MYILYIHIIELWETWCKGVKPVREPASLPTSNVETRVGERRSGSGFGWWQPPGLAAEKRVPCSTSNL